MGNNKKSIKYFEKSLTLYFSFVPVGMFTPRRSVLRHRQKRKIDNGQTATVLTRGSCKIITYKTRKPLKSKNGKYLIFVALLSIARRVELLFR